MIASSLLLLGTLLLAFSLVRKDYGAAVARGSGGILFNLFRYIEINFFRIFRVSNPRVAEEVAPKLWMQRGYLETLPVRAGVRPEVKGIAPQRQITQTGPKQTYDDLSNVIVEFARLNYSRCYLGRSTFKNNNTAIFGRTTSCSHANYHGEICHAHPNDGSMHLHLHPADVKTVLEAGWGERHPLARTNWWWNLICPIPAGFTLVYSPRNSKELVVMENLVGAAAWWVNGVDSKSIKESWS